MSKTGEEGKRYDITLIEKLFPNWYDPNAFFSKDEQQWIWENIPLPEEDEERLMNIRASEGGVNLTGSVNGTYKHEVNAGLFSDKNDIISQLKKCTHKTPPREIASLLEQLFVNWESKEGHWLFVAQNWTPRAISRVITQMVKQHKRGDEVIHLPPAYFTHLIKFRKKRKRKRGELSRDNSRNLVEAAEKIFGAKAEEVR